ncbi:MAG: GntR family transcriptional regulator [Oscillospiraceae bacterium]
MIDKNSSVPLYVLVKEYILKLILSGEYPAKSKLPTEFELMKKLDVGRATVRSALAQLENEGTIIKKHGVGTFVVERGRAFGFEPFISLSFMLDKIGLKGTNSLVEMDKITISDGLLTKGWVPGKEVHHIKRLRYADNFPIAIEDFYLTEDLFSKIDGEDMSSSLAHTLLSKVDWPIGKIDSQIIVREPHEDERKTLSLKDDSKLVELTRWMYFEGHDCPENFVKFVIPLNALEFPFLR